MGRKAKGLSCSDGDKKELERRSRSQREPQRVVERARIILGLLDGETQVAVARHMGLRPNTVNKWRGLFISYGLAGLEDAPRSGRPKSVGKDLRERAIKLLETPPPKGQAAWDGKTLAAALDAKKSSVYNLLAKEGIQLQRLRSWCVSNDPNFATKAADIVGLYLNPPERAIVFCVDEKPSIQALSRRTGYTKTSAGAVVRGVGSTYRRNGVLNLFAALNVATGHVNSKTTDTKKRVDFIAFMDQVMADILPEQQVHIILDNYCTHKKNEDWLKAHPNVTFHFTPTSASWMNMVEVWLGILSRKALKGASFDTTRQLAQAIQDFCDAYNPTAKPFVWKKRQVNGSQLKNTIANLLD